MLLALLLAATSPLSPDGERVGVRGDASTTLELRGDFTDDDRAAFAEGLATLPERLRHPPTGTLVLELDPTAPPTPSGIATPEWTPDGHFLLTRQEGSETFRDAALDPTTRHHLWRARAIVHALLSRWDDVEHWSTSPTWRRTNGWLLPFERPLSLGEHALNHARTAFARPRGMASARLDLLTFAEAALVPVTQGLDDDDLLRCQDFTRLRAFHRVVLGDEWQPGRCPAFDGWVREDELERLEVLLVQSSGRAPESLFGHLLVRPVWKTSLGPSFDTVVQFGAITPSRPDALHLVRGVFGGYSLGVFTLSLTDLEREKRSGEQRSLSRWELRLDAGERRRFLERAWEFERRGRFAYAFFSDNCASLLVWMLESSLDPADAALPQWPRFITSPAGVLDDLFRARRKDGGRLLEPLLPALEATGVIAQRAEARRRALEAGLALPFEGTHATDVATRAAAYATLAEASRGAPPSTHHALAEWWAQSVRVERAQADVALAERRELEERLVEGTPLDLEALWNERLTRLEQETVLQQQLMLLDRQTFLEDLRRKAKQRPPTDAEARERAEQEAQLALFSQVAEAHAVLVSEVFPAEDDAAAFLAADDAQAHATQATVTVRSLQVSGHWRASLGAGAMVDVATGAAAPVVRVDEAGLLEALGEQRARAAGPHVGLRVLEGSLTLETRSPSVVQSHFTLMAFDSLAPPMEPAPWWRRHLGFGFEATSDFRAWRSAPWLNGVAGWVFAHASDAEGRNFLAVGAGPAGWVASSSSGSAWVAPMGGVSTRVTGRLALGTQWPSALRLEAWHQSVWGPSRVLHEVRAEASLEWVVVWGQRPRLLVRPTVSVSVEPAVGRGVMQGVLVLEPAESLIDLFSAG